MRRYEIALVKGDGIGPEVAEAGVQVLQTALSGTESGLDFIEYPAGAGCFLETGEAFPEETFEGCRKADAIFHGAAGIPGVVHRDGTEAGLDFGLKLRFRLDLYANVRPIKLYQGITSPLRWKEAGDIDYVILRENTEGLYAARGGGNLLRDKVATDTIVVTRDGIERIVRFAFRLARQRGRGAPLDRKQRVTCCDKANVLKSYAYFRKVFIEVAQEFPEVETDFALIDAMTVHLLERPEFYDVIVTENMFGDIISDLGSATVGGMGMSPTAELGDDRGFFQAAHGSAPTIAGKGIANPLGTILAGRMMLDWLAERHQDDTLGRAADRIERAVRSVIDEKRIVTPDLGGKARTMEVTDAVCQALTEA